MLNITYFDKVKYKSIDFMNRDKDFFGAGVVHLTDFPLTYPATPNMTVNVGAGASWVDGYRVSNDSNVVSLTFNAADVTNPRIDIIQIGYTASTDANGDTTGNAVLQVKQGVAAVSPIEPGADPGFVKLYAVSIAANQSTVTAANVTDRRTLVPINVDGSQITNFSGVTSSYLQAVLQDLFGNTAVVLDGGVATKDGTVATQLDVTAASVYFANGQHVNFSASQNGQFVTSASNATYYLDYNSDGTTSWSTSHSAKSGYVPICSVATDGSGNISTVTDARPTTVHLLGGATGPIQLGVVQATSFAGDGSKLTNLPIQPVSDASQTAAGIVSTTQNPSGTPTASTRVADAEEIELTSTAATTVATFTPTQNGFFEIACHFRLAANVSVGITVSYAGSQGAATTTILNSTPYTFTSGGDNDYDVIPVTIRAVSGTPINVQFTASVANAVYASANITGR